MLPDEPHHERDSEAVTGRAEKRKKAARSGAAFLAVDGVSPVHSASLVSDHFFTPVHPLWRECRKRPLPHNEQIAERFFSQQENQIFKSLPAEQRGPAFFNCWTRKEAYIKAIGEGLSCPLDAFDVTLAPGEPARLLRIHGRKQAASSWSLHAFTPRPDYTAALAVTGRDWQLSFWQWLNLPGAAGGIAK